MKNHREPVLYEGLLYIIPLVVLSIIVAFMGRTFLSLVPLSTAIFIAFFFRNPEREIPSGENIIVSPADGKVILVKDIYDEEIFKGKAIMISIFLSLFDVHINRTPCSGEVVEVKRKRGRFLPAFKERASLENEQVSILISYNGHQVLVRQVAGVIARRVVCWAKAGYRVERGQRYGLIRFGSRVDIFLPDKTELKVKLGDKVKGGKTILGVLS